MAYVFRPGDPPGFCARCAKKVHVSELRREWTGHRVCGGCYDTRNAQEFVRGVADRQQVPGGPAPEPPDVFQDSWIQQPEDL